MADQLSRFVEIASEMLEPDERDAVRGDLAESGASARQALRDVLGLVARRQAALWKHWRPWLALAGLVPLGMLLSLVARRTADGSAIYIWMYANNWDWAILDNPAFWLILAPYAAKILLAYLILSCVACASGFALGSVSRQAVYTNAALFCLVVLILGPPSRHIVNNQAVFSLTFYSAIFPLIVQTMLVLLPSLWGMRWAALKEKHP